MKTHIFVSTLIFGTALLGCGAVANAGNNDSLLNDSLPGRWMYQGELETVQLPENDKWWELFDDIVLDSLIESGLENNYNLSVAARRIEIAGNTVKTAAAAYYPTLGLNASWTKNRTSGMTGNEPGPAGKGSFWDIGLSMSWEIDLFGKITSRVKHGKSLYRASKAEYAGAMLALASNIASTYFQLRVWQAERQVALEHTERQLRVVKITEDRLDCDLGNMLEVTQAREVYYSTMASIPVLENSINTAINSLAILVGKYPEELYEQLMADSPLPDYHALVPVGMPADLLSRRPDIVQARLELAAYAQALGIARKDFLPTLTINGSIGVASHDISDVFDKSAVSYSISPTLSWTLFDGLSRKYNTAIAREQLQIGIDNYNLVVMTAVQDVDNAMSSYKASLLYIAATEKLLEQSNKALDLALDLYKSSLTQFSNVVDAQMNVLENQNSLIVARGRALSDIVKLHEAVGGGWNGIL